MSAELPPRPPGAEYSLEEWDRMIPICDRVSARLLTLLQEEIGEGEGMNPQMAGVTLLIATGRLAGRYGYRHLGAQATWDVWHHESMEPLFRRGFRFERGKED